MTRVIREGWRRRLRLALGHALPVGAMLVAAYVASCTREEPAEEVRAVALVTTAAVVRGDLEERLTAYGVLEPAPNDEVPINLDVESSVVRVLVKGGQQVKAGEPLVEVRSSGTARLDAERARIDVDLATKELARLQTMRATGLATNADVAQQEAALDKSKAESALFGGGGRTHVVRAPSAGLVRTIAVKPGDVVAPGGPLLLMSGSGARRVRLGIDPADLPRVKTGARVTLAPVHAPDAVVDGIVAQVHPHVDVDTHQAAAIAVAVAGAAPSVGGAAPGLGAADTFVDGALCRGDVVVREERGALVVPRASVVTRAGESWVFVVAGTGEATHARRVVVRAVLDDGARVAVSGPLQEGALVIVIGVSEVEDGMVVRVADGAAATSAEAEAEAGAPSAVAERDAVIDGGAP